MESTQAFFSQERLTRHREAFQGGAFKSPRWFSFPSRPTTSNRWKKLRSSDSTCARDVEAPVRANKVGRIKTNFFRRFEDYDPTALEGNSNKKLFQSEAFVHHCTISCNSVTPLLRQLEEERLVGVNPTRNISPLTVSDIT